jgi:hypothetical protein
MKKKKNDHISNVQIILSLIVYSKVIQLNDSENATIYSKSMLKQIVAIRL